MKTDPKFKKRPRLDDNLSKMMSETISLKSKKDPKPNKKRLKTLEMQHMQRLPTRFSKGSDSNPGTARVSVSKGKTHFGNFGRVGRQVVTPRTGMVSRQFG